MNMANIGFPSTDNDKKYQLLTKIGSGGMGDVYLGIQRGAIDFSRLVVLKRIHDHLFQQDEPYRKEHLSMFINEASLVASLNHPNIVKIYDFCLTGNSVCIVMEYVEGETLKYIFKNCVKQNKALPIELACRLILDAADALHSAHTSTSETGDWNAVIHRDIGLHNLMLDSNGFLKIIDFGIAKSSIQVGVTSPGLIKGNPGYMAPELFNEENSDHRVDIYALGLCLYELITLTRAFKFESKTSFGSIMQAILTRELPRPSEIVPDLPAGIDDIVFKAVNKNREERYQTVDDFARELKQWSNQLNMAECEPKEWFKENFSDRLKQRREFGAKMMSMAKQAEASTDLEKVFPSQPRDDLFEINSISPASATVRATPGAIEGQTTVPTMVTSTRLEILEPSNLYKLIAVLFLFFIGCASVVYFLFFKDSSSREKVIAEDNLFISSEPTGTSLSIDGRELGTVGGQGLSLYVMPNIIHNIVLKKEGYRDYELPIITPDNGSKKIDAVLLSLKPKEISPDETDQAATEYKEGIMAGVTDRADKKIGHAAQREPASVRQREPSISQVVQEEEKNDTRQPLRSMVATASVDGRDNKISVIVDDIDVSDSPNRSDDLAGTQSKVNPQKPNETGSHQRRRIPLPDDEDRKIPLLDDENDEARSSIVD